MDKILTSDDPVVAKIAHTETSAFFISYKDGLRVGIIYAAGKKAARREAVNIIFENSDMPRDLIQKYMRCRPATEHDENMNPNFGSGIN